MSSCVLATCAASLYLCESSQVGWPFQFVHLHVQTIHRFGQKLIRCQLKIFCTIETCGGNKENVVFRRIMYFMISFDEMSFTVELSILRYFSFEKISSFVFSLIFKKILLRENVTKVSFHIYLIKLN